MKLHGYSMMLLPIIMYLCFSTSHVVNGASTKNMKSKKEKKEKNDDDVVPDDVDLFTPAQSIEFFQSVRNIKFLFRSVQFSTFGLFLYFYFTNGTSVYMHCYCRLIIIRASILKNSNGSMRITWRLAELHVVSYTLHWGTNQTSIILKSVRCVTVVDLYYALFVFNTQYYVIVCVCACVCVCVCVRVCVCVQY